MLNLNVLNQECQIHLGSQTGSRSQGILQAGSSPGYRGSSCDHCGGGDHSSGDQSGGSKGSGGSSGPRGGERSEGRGLLAEMGPAAGPGEIGV